MVNQNAIDKARLSMKIDGRYTQPNSPGLNRRDWTPAQKRRMRKKRRKHGLGIFEMHV
jgi:hypothetical protein